MEMLNLYLQSIGCQNTQFRNPHGLHHPDHWSTAYDMALIAKRALRIPKFRKLISTLTYTKPKTNKQPECALNLTNPLMKPKSRYYYPKAIGGKTGYTSAAQKTMVAAAEYEGRTLIAVVFGCEKSESRFEDVKKLFEAAFSEEKAMRRLMGPEHVFVKEIAGSKTPCKATPAKALTIEYFPSEEPQCKAALHWDVEKLPIRKGQKVGEVLIQDEHHVCLQRGDLLALEEVNGSFFYFLKEKLTQLNPFSKR
jgi:D-alanyl-D-alanine carboxypeptidase (penicillin-binding protein 5/6)